MLVFPTNHPEKKIPNPDRVREKICRGMITDTDHSMICKLHVSFFFGVPVNVKLIIT